MFDPIALPWLPAAQSDFRTQVAALKDIEKPGGAIRQLATHALDASQLRQLSRVIKKAMPMGKQLAPLSALKLAVLSNTTFDFIADVAPASAARHGVALDLHVAPLDLIEQEAFNPDSETYKFTPDATLVAIDARWLGLDVPVIDTAKAQECVTAAIDRLTNVVSALAENGGKTPIICTVPVPKNTLFGSYDRSFAGSVRNMVSAFNDSLAELAGAHGGLILDIAALAETVGLARWFDTPLYYLYKLPFAADVVPLYADWLGRLLGSMRGKARKCLVLDLDNTCWGGVIGDDGIEGIRIGAGNAEGEAFLAVQQTALMLKQRGIILAVSSKNNDANARAPFRNHPDMALREDDIAVFQANWQDKASNIEAIAATLEIGLDALVFLDDNGAERAQVRAALPMVAVPELPSDASHYPDLLLAAGYFEAVNFSEEDSGRAQSYSANAQRVEVKKQARNLGDYLSSLEMKISHASFDALGRPRIAQLINKSNQFNLTTQRYSEAEVAEMETDPQNFTMQTRLSDRFGNLGMIGVVIAKPHADAPNAWTIDTWLMSCRVLGRKVEQAMLAQLIRSARERGIETIYAQYLPTEKNNMVKEHYDNLSFTLLEQHANGAREYRISVDGFNESELPFQADWF